ncbi:glycoside hydrolase family 88 protein [Siphonobacter sp.]|uniref:glycoside hydrolase family 88 protein n=1 Tax=Siphonobacter sp. TaxID=1869184 RepID=UPI003B3AD4BF
MFLRRLVLSILGTVLALGTYAQEPWSVRMANSMLAQAADSSTVQVLKSNHWNYEQGVLLNALNRVWERTGDGKYFHYIQKSIDAYVNDQGDIRTYKFDDYNIDNIPTGRLLLMLYQQTGKEKYLKAAQFVHSQLETQPRTKEGGYWHKKRYPNQMWLDGLYMAEPFSAEYALIFKEPKHFDNIANQFIWMEKNSRDEKTGLLYHAYDESRQQKWADPKTGKSPNFWGRAIGWYVMALVDVLDYFPMDHPKRPELVAIYKRLMPAVVKYQDPASGCWWQVTDKGGKEGNYLEASASSMFVYGLAKGVRTGLLDASYLKAAQKGYAGMLKEFIKTDDKGLVHLDKTVSVGGLGGDPYRDGSYEYYLSEKIRLDDLKGVGPFILASIEVETIPELSVGKGKTVGLDYFFNNERTSKGERFHYTWEDYRDSGYSLWGSIFRDYGAKTVSVPEAPTAASLKKLNVYIIVDPDTKKETPQPNYMTEAYAKVIADWVKGGGTLVLLANDTSNAEIKNFNILAGKFGIQFTDKNVNMVKNNVYDQGKFVFEGNHPVFGNTKKIFVKEVVTLTTKAPAKPVLTANGDQIMAVAEVGKGRVFVLGDPWIYNEYLNGKRLPMEFENFKAAKELSKWLLKK